MAKESIKIMPVYSPYQDIYMDCECKFETHIDKKGKLLGASITSIVSDEGIDLMKYLDADKIPYELEQQFVKEYS